LHNRLLPHRADRIGQALEPVVDHHAHFPYAAVLDLRQDAQPILGALTVVVLAGLQAQDVAPTVDGDAQGHVDGPVTD
jgi:hypothetical protein